MISIICCTKRQNFMENVFQNYERQVWKDKELIIVLNRNDMDINNWIERAKQHLCVSVYQLPEETTLGECLNYGIEKSKNAYIAKFDDDDYYAPNYLTESITALNDKGADIVGKRSVYMYFEEWRTLAIYRPGRENRFVKRGLKGATLLFKREIWEEIKFPSKNQHEDDVFLKFCRQKGYKLYSTDKCNFVVLRTASPQHQHTSGDNNWLISKCSIVCETDDYQSIAQCNKENQS